MENTIETKKTHWLQSPNKNYLGHWDLGEKELVLTIKSAKWETVKNPIKNTSEEKRVVRFVEDVKPFICNQINAQAIMQATGIKFMEDMEGKNCKIQLFVGKFKKGRNYDEQDCIRVRPKVTILSMEEVEQKINDCKSVNDLAKVWGTLTEGLQNQYKEKFANKRKDLGL